MDAGDSASLVLFPLRNFGADVTDQGSLGMKEFETKGPFHPTFVLAH